LQGIGGHAEEMEIPYVQSKALAETVQSQNELSAAISRP